jgi:predicted amidohydrolase
LLGEAAAGGAELAVLPEYFCMMGARDTDKLGLRETAGTGTVQGFLADAAREFGIWIVGGTLPLETGDETRVFNSSLAYSPDGEQVARYDKIHLFFYDNGRERYDERRVISPGTEPVCFDLPSRDGHRWRIGMSVCYDLRFPELYRALARQGAELLLVPSAFTRTTGAAHWEVLLRARAIENLAWVVAPAQGGTHENGRHTWGQSMVVDPWGTVVAQQASEEGVVLFDLDAGQIERVRTQLPVLSHCVL